MQRGYMAVTLMEIANRAKVSVMAVSAVVNNTRGTRVSQEKREMIERIAREMGYRSNILARTLRGGSSRMIGVVIDSHAPAWLHVILRAIETEATANGYRILVSEEHDSVENVVIAYEKFQQYGVDGMICLAYDYPGQQEVFTSFFADKNNVVLVGACIQTSLPQIFIDLEPCYRGSLSHFQHSGRTRIGGVIASVPNSGQEIRLELYKKLCTELGIAPLIFNPEFCATTDDYLAEVDRLITDFVLPQKLNALLVHSDVMGAFVISGLARHGLRVPDDVAVITEDNQAFCAALQPPMACIDHNEYEIGVQAFQTMLKLLRKENVTEKILIPCKLILRESAGKIPREI